MRYYKNLTVPNNGTESDWMDYDDEKQGNLKVFPNGISYPANLDGTAMRIELDVDGTTRVLKDELGSDYPLTIDAAGGFIPFSPAVARVLRSYRWRIKTATAQTPAANFKIVFNDL